MTAFTWKKTAGGDWSTAADWAPDCVPGAGDDVTLPLLFAPYTVTVTSAEAANSLTIEAGATLSLSARLTISGNLNAVFGTLDLNPAGIIAGATIFGAGIVFNGGTLCDVTYVGPVDLSADNARVNIAGGITLVGASGGGPGGVQLTGGGSQLYILDSETLDAATIAIGNASATVLGESDAAGGTLTLGINLAIVQTSGSAELVTRYANDTIVNLGTISNTGGQLVIAGPDGGGFVNLGTIDTAGTLVVDPSTLVNAGYISGSVTLAGSSTLDNTAAGMITADHTAIYGTTSPNTVINDGTIVGGGGAYAISLSAGGYIGNGVSGLISGADAGIRLYGGGTVSNRGTIAGGAGTAVAFYGDSDNRLVLDPGYTLGGAAIGGAGANATNVLELASGGSAGSLSGLGVRFENFGTVTVDAGATWALTGALAGTLVNDGTVDIAGGATLGLYDVVAGGGSIDFTASGGRLAVGSAPIADPIGGFAAGDAIDFTTFAYASSVAVSYSAHLLTVSGGVQAPQSLTMSGVANGTKFSVTSDGHGGTLVEAFMPGGSTFSGTITSGIVLSSGAQNPATVVSGAYVTNVTSGHSGDALYGAAGYAWTVTNYGTLNATQRSGAGVVLTAGGTIINEAGAQIDGYTSGVGINNGVGVVINAGTIHSIVGDGVALRGGGTVANLSGGVISGVFTYLRGYDGIYIAGGAGSVSNSGTIGNDIALLAGGNVTNAAGGTVAAAVTVQGVSGTVANAGTIVTSKFAGIRLGAGGNVSNAAHGVVIGYTDAVFVTGGAGTVVNYGTIVARRTAGSKYGVYLASGGLISNAAGGLIDGVRDQLAGTVTNSGLIVGDKGARLNGGTLINYGTLAGSADGVQIVGGRVVDAAGGLILGGAFGVYTQVQPATIGNSGTIVGATGAGLFMLAGGTLNNASGGLVAGYAGLRAFSSAATVINAGSIVGIGTAGDGIYLGAGGLVSNAGQLIGAVGVVVGSAGSGNDTIVDSGTIVGTSGVAINFGGGSGLLVLEPGYRLVGVVSGGTSPGATNRLELAGGDDEPGVVGALDSEFLNFGAVTVDAGAQWSVSGSVGSAVTITDFGTIGGAIAILSGGHETVEAGGVAIGPVIAGGSVDVRSGGAMSGAVTFAAGTSGGQLAVVDLAAPLLSGGNVISGFAQGDLIDLSSLPHGSIASYAFSAGNVLDIKMSAGHTYAIQFDPAASFAGERMTLTGDAASGTDVELVPTSGATFGSTNSGIVLSNPATQIPATITAGADITNTTESQNGDAVYGTNAAAWTLTNYGTVNATQAGSDGVYFAAGGSVDNRAEDLIAGTRNAINLRGTGTVVNRGTIAHVGIGTRGEAVYLNAGGLVTNYGRITGARAGTSNGGGYPGAIEAHNQPATVVNLGTIDNPNNSDGINLLWGGLVLNGTAANAAALITAPHTGIYMGGRLGVAYPGAIGTVVNYGTIAGGANHAVVLKSGGTVRNTGTITAVTSNAAVFIDNAYGLVTNAGLIENPDGRGVHVAAGVVVNEAGAQIVSGTATNSVALGSPGTGETYVGIGTLANYGTITNTSTTSAAVFLGDGGTITNGSPGAAAALIAGPGTAVGLKNAAGTVVNFGTIVHTGDGTSGFAVYLGAGGIVSNAGLLSGAATGTPVSGGTGGYPGVVVARNEPATVVNLGTIANPSDSNGVNLLRGGLIVNGAAGDASATIVVPHIGLYMGGRSGIPYPGAVGTVVNYGEIGSTDGHIAIDLAAGGTVVNLGTVYNTGGTGGVGVYLPGGGLVRNGAAGTPGALIASDESVAIELTGGSGTVVNFGTIAGVGTHSAINFNFTAGTPGLLDNYGLVSGNVAGASVVSPTAPTSGTVTIVNQGTMVGPTGVLIGTTESGDNTIVNFGTIIGTAGTAVYFGAGQDTLIIEAGSTLVGVVANFQTGDTIDLPFLSFGSGGSATLLANNVLQVAEGGGTFAVDLDPGQSFAGETFVLTSDGAGGTDVGLQAAPGATFGSTNSGIVLSDPATQIPATITSGAYVTNVTGNHNGDAVYGTNAAAWTLTNYGTVVATQTFGIGVNFVAGGTLDNSGTIVGHFDGAAFFTTSGAVTNSGVIAATETVTGGSTIYSFGVIAFSGVIDNSGTISDAALYHGIGAQLDNGGTVYNTGTISNVATDNRAVQFLSAGGLVVNGTSGSTEGLITGYRGGVAFFPTTIANAGTLTIVNYGTIEATAVTASGTNGDTGIQAAGTYASLIVDNFGTIGVAQTYSSPGTVGVAVAILLAQGTITNEAGGLIDAASGCAIAASSVTGAGVNISNAGTITAQDLNHSTIYIGRGGGTITNSGSAALVTGARNAISFGTTGGTGVVVNFGTIAHTGSGTSGEAVAFADGGTVTNYGLISGARAGTSSGNGYPGAIEAHYRPATVFNFGTIDNPNNSDGINLLWGGLVLNGTLGSTSATITAPHDGIYMGGRQGTSYPGAAGTVVNDGTIASIGSYGAPAVHLAAGGTIVNQNLIASDSGNGVAITGDPGTVNNFGTIVSDATRSNGVLLAAGGIVTNGAADVTTALIDGLWIGADLVTLAGTVVNFGTIESTATFEQPGTVAGGAATVHGVGVLMHQGGLLINGTAGSNAGVILGYGHGAYIGGASGVPNPGAVGTLINHGTIASTATTALSGIAGVALSAGGTIVNLGTIDGAANPGVVLKGAVPETVSNSGLIAGSVGVFIDSANSGGNTIVNAGTITGGSGTAVQLAGSGNRVVVDPGAVFGGAIDGGGGSGDILELAPGTGTLPASFAFSDTSGALEILVDAGAAWTADFTGTLPAGATLVDSGSLTFGAAPANLGTIDIEAGAVLRLTSGLGGSGSIDFAASGGVLAVGGTVMPANTIVGFGSAGTIDMLNIAGGGAGTATIGAGNVLTVSEGGQSHTFQLDPSYNFTGRTVLLAGDGASGTDVTIASALVVGSGQTLVVSAGETVSNVIVQGGGTLEIQSGGTAVGTLITDGGEEIIDAGGRDLSGTVASGGFQDVFGAASATLIIAGGRQTVQTGGVASNTVLDDGAVETVSSGGTASGTVVSAGDAQIVLAGGVAIDTTVASGGSAVIAAGGTLSGAEIAGGLVDLQAGALYGDGVVDFSGSGGTLEIDAASVSATLTVGGFGVTDVIDLRGVPYTSALAASVSGGIVTITSGGAVIDQWSLNGLPDTALLVVSDGAGGSDIELGTISGLVVSAGETVVVSAGEVFVSTIVLGDGVLEVAAGGTASATSLESAANEHVDSGGIEIGATIAEGAFQYVSGTATGTTIDAFGEQEVEEDGVATATTVSGDGRQSVYGIALDTTVGGGIQYNYGITLGTTIDGGGQYDYGIALRTILGGAGNQYVGYNGTAIKTTVASGALLSDYGTAIDTTLQFGGELIVGGDGRAFGITVAGGALARVEALSQTVYLGVTTQTVSGTSLVGTTIDGFTLLDVVSGGVASGTTADTTGIIVVGQGGAAIATTVAADGAVIVSAGGVVSGTSVAVGGSVDVLSGGAAIGTTLNGGYQQVDAGGAAGFTSIGDGGEQTIGAGGSASGTWLTGGSTQLVYGVASDTTLDASDQLVAAGGAAMQTIVGGDSQQNVSGLAVGTTISDGGNQDVTGVAAATTIADGGVQTVAGGGAVAATAITGAGEQDLNGGIAAATTIASGGLQQDSGAAVATVLALGAEQIVTNTAAALATTAADGVTLATVSALNPDNNTTETIYRGVSVQVLSATGSGAAIAGNTLLEVDNGGVAVATAVGSAGIVEVLAGGSASATNVSAGGAALVASGGSASGTTVAVSGAIDVLGGTASATTLAGGYQLVTSSGTAIGTVITGRGRQDVAFDATASGTTISGSGVQNDYGTASGTTIVAGSQLVYGIATGTILAGGSQIVSGVATDTTMTGGAQTVQAGGVVSGTTIAGGTETVYGLASDTTIGSAGRQYVYYTGTVVSSTVRSGGQQNLYGGTASGTTVGSGGTLSIYGGSARDATIAGGGVVQLSYGSLSGVTLDPGSELAVQLGGQLFGIATANGAALATVEERSATVYLGVAVQTLSTTLSAGTIAAFSELSVGAGGLAFGAIVGSAGVLAVSAGGAASGTTVSAAGAVMAFSGADLAGTTVLTSGVVDVLSGATVSGTVLAGGDQLIDAGGTASDTQINNGNEVVSAGGRSINAAIAGGEQLVYGSASGVTITGGEQLVYGSATGVTIVGGEQVVYGSATGVTISGGAQLVYGNTTDTTIAAGGDQEVDGGAAVATAIGSGGLAQVSYGTISGATLDIGGTLIVHLGGDARDTTVTGGATLATISAQSETFYFGASAATVSGAMVTDTVVAGFTLLEVISGGVAAGGTVAAAGVVDVSAGGAATDITILGSGGLVVEAGGSAAGATVSAAGSVDVFDGGVASGTALIGGYQLVDAGGVASATTIDQFGTEEIAAGGVASGTTVHNGTQYVYGSATGTTIDRAAGRQYVYGAAVSTLIDAGGTQEVEAGGTASGTTVSLGSQDDYGSVSGTVIDTGGSQRVEAGAQAFDTDIAGGSQDVYGSASGTTIDAGGSQNVEGGGLTAATTINSGGVQVVFGRASDTTLAVGGAQIVWAGGVASGTTAANGAVLVTINGQDETTYIGASVQTLGEGTLSGQVVASAGTLLDVGSGGLIADAAITNLGVVEMLAGGAANGVVVASGGALLISAGGTASDAVVVAGAVADVFAGGVATDTFVSGGYQDVAAGGAASGTVIQNGGRQDVETGGNATATTIAGGTQYVYGSAGDTIIGRDGTQYAFGTATNTTIDSGGVQYVEGSADGSTIDSGGVQYVYGTADGTTVLGGGELFVEGGNANAAFIASGGVLRVDYGAADNTSIGLGGLLITAAGGSADGITAAPGATLVTLSAANQTYYTAVAAELVSDTTISGVLVGRGTMLDVISGGEVVGAAVATGGILQVSGGVVSGVAVTDDGALLVSAGGTVFGAAIGSGGIFQLAAGGVASGTVLSGADQIVGSGATAVGTVVVGGGSQTVAAGGVADSTLLDSNAVLTVFGTASDTTIGGGDTEIVESGGTTIDPTIAGGVLQLYSGSTVSGTIGFAGPSGRLGISGTVPTAPISGFGIGDTIDLPGLLFTAATSASFDSSTNRLTVSGGNGADTLTLLGVVPQAQFVAANDGRGGTAVTIRLSPPPPPPSQLYDFVYTYSGSSDYYQGTVADNGSFGYTVSQTVTTDGGVYTILANAGMTSEASGAVSVTYYSHSGPGAASSIPVTTGNGSADGSDGLGSEQDTLRGTDGNLYAFSSSDPVNMPTNALYSFVFSYNDGAAFYTGTVAAAPGTPPPLPSASLGTYAISADGATLDPVGTVVVDRFTLQGASFLPSITAGGGRDGTAGLGSESDTITVNGLVYAFSAQNEPSATVNTPLVPTSPAPPPATVQEAEIEQIYSDILSRTPNAAELSDGANQLANGTSVAAFSAALANSAEAQNLLTARYQQVVGSVISSTDLANYTQLLAGGSSQAGILLLIAESPAGQQAIGSLYQQVLDRQPDGAELNAMSSYLGSGSYSLAQLQQALSVSLEAQDDLTTLFQTIIERPPDAAELAAMEDRLAAGTTQADLASALTQSGATALMQNGSVAGYVPITAGPGDSDLSAVSGTPTLFLFTDTSFGHVTITGFDPTQDAIQLSDATVSGSAQLQTDTTAANGGTLISFNAGQSIFLDGIAPSQLAAANFYIDPPADTVTATDQQVGSNQAIALANIFSIIGPAASGYQIWLQGPADGVVTDGTGAIPTGQAVDETSLAGLTYIGGADPGTDKLWLRSFDGQWSSWTLATLTDPGVIPDTVTAANRSVGGQQTVTLDDVFAVSGPLPSAYEVWLNAPADGAVTDGNGPIPVGRAVSETSLGDVTFSGGAVPGQDQLWVRAFDGRWSGWALATLTDAGNVTAGAKVVAYQQSVPLSSIFAMSGGTPTGYEVWLDSPGDGSVIDGNGAIPTGQAVSEASLNGVDYVGGAAPGADTLWLRADLAGQWTAWVAATITDLGVPPDTVTTTNQSVQYQQSVALGSIFAVNGPTPSAYQLWLSGPAVGAVTDVNGAIATGVAVDETSLSNVSYIGGGAPGQDQLWLRTYDGQWSSWALATVSDPGVPQDTVTAVNQTVAYGTTVGLAGLFPVSGPAPSEYQVWLSGPAVGSVTDASGAIATDQAVTETSLSGVAYVGSAAAGQDQLWLRAFDGQWSDWALATLSDPGALTPRNQVVGFGQQVAVSSIFASTGGVPDQYQLWLDGPADGEVLDGAGPIATDTAVTETSVSGVSYVGGAAAGQDMLWMRAEFGGTWTGWVSANLTDPGVTPPTVTPTQDAQTVPRGQEAIAAQNLFAVSDNSAAVTQFGFWDLGTGGGHFTVGGVAQGVNQEIDVAAAKLSQVEYVAGTGTDTLWVRANDGQWSHWSSPFTVAG